ncbi:adaptor protein MecA [Staphylococcus chromogenes]|uniref:Adapter protein MecA n=1 Tax=Staphylococcus chromogenes TaxID=46126 RepID=A0AAE5T0E3_STACR|nr:adaptor protein MecA [Staphylococcus chromogenes]KDP13707.1 adaptor protein [Staphylococcus chromogenes MU 970]MBP0045295.1 adaptor protein MecA [Staphylococcus chromogenes]MBV5137663.1 adaptor protein MecA [Staphylococcus chromogenes]MBV5191080.1 adaptor protein MecA [Staphylococcus chromogenes]MBW3131679.1 adaptor protein MecA [Staphylococcus chromogenes]
MRIERIDDMTVKLFITYKDIEARGFRREDLWTNRKRGEEFFWSMMEEINQEEDFVVEGPLWIQVHAFEKGVEVTISKSKNDELMQMSEEDSALDEFDSQLNDLLSQSLKAHSSETQEDDLDERETTQATRRSSQMTSLQSNTLIFKFDDLETLIAYAHQNNQKLTQYEDLLYMFNDTYYYMVHFDQEVTEEAIHDFYGQALEYASPTDKTEVFLNDYAKIVMSHNVTEQVKRYFPNK